MIERDDNHVFRPTIKISMKKIHRSPHTKSASRCDTGWHHDSDFSNPSLLYEESEQVVLVVEAPRSKLVTLAAQVEQTKLEFRDCPPSPVLRVTVDEEAELIGGRLGE